MKRTTLYSGKSDYGNYKVVEMNYNGRPARVLFGDTASPQSGVALDDEPELLFSYNQRFLEMIMSINPKKVLIIGGGAFMLPTAAFHQFPKLTIDVVEIDPHLVQLAEQYFDLPNDKRLRVHIGDGLKFIQASKQRYDMIIIDAFSGYTIPPHLLENTTLKQYARHLSRKGVVAINFISEYKNKRKRMAHELVAAFSEVFAATSIYQADADFSQGDEQNMIIAASTHPLYFDYLQSDELEIINI